MRVQARAGGSWQDNARNRAESSLISDLQRVGKTRVGDAWTRVRAPFTTIGVYTRCSEQYRTESMGSSFKTMIAKLLSLSLSLSLCSVSAYISSARTRVIATVRLSTVFSFFLAPFSLIQRGLSDFPHPPAETNSP